MQQELSQIPSLEQEELRSVSRTVAEIEWLLLVLVLLYQVFGGPTGEGRIATAMALFFYAAFIMIFHYSNFYTAATRWKLAIETWGMIGFITAALWFTGKLESPLVNCYLLVIITSALALGRLTTLVELGLIGACFLLLGNYSSMHDLYTLSYAGSIIAQFIPFVLVAYITSMFSSDIRYGLNKAKLVSETDELTELFNRRGFAIAAGRLLGQAVRYQRALSVVMIDADNLKEINDKYGHKAGDRLLIKLVRSIQTQLRDSDIMGRYGGDEFVVLLPEATANGALDVAERIREAVSNMSLEFNGDFINVTVSMGVATFPEDGRTLDSLVDNADKGMYKAKMTGRDKIMQCVK